MIGWAMLAVAVASGAQPVSPGLPALFENASLRISEAGPDGIAIESHELNSGRIRTLLRIRLASASAMPIRDESFGSGSEWSGLDPAGQAMRVRAFPDLPFVLVQSNLRRPDGRPAAINQVPVALMTADLGIPANRMAAMGTGGRQPLSAGAGSYAWLALADPDSGHAVVAGWLTHDRATGTLFASPAQGGAVINARADYGRNRWTGDCVRSESLLIGCFVDGRRGLEAWAEAVALHYGVHLPHQPAGYCSWYADEHGKAGDQASTEELARFAARELLPYGFDVLQIDDGWQAGDGRSNGPKKNFTRVDPHGPYPRGMAPAAAAIASNGLIPGLWLMPFAASESDSVFRNHPDWLVKNQDGTVHEVIWGGSSLDLTNQGARDYLAAMISRIRRDWGFRYLKLDGLFTGLGAEHVYVNAGYKEDRFGATALHDPTVSAVAAFRSGLALIRAAAGPDTFLLGCSAAQNMRSYGASLGRIDAMRIGPDNAPTWKGWFSTSALYGSRHYFLNRRVWYNDPDVVYVRAPFTLDEARTAATWTAVSGQLFFSGDWLPGLPRDRLEILRRTLAPCPDCVARPIEYFHDEVPESWMVEGPATPQGRRTAAFFNWSDQPQNRTVSAAELGLPSVQYAAVDFWSGRFLPAGDHFRLTLPAHGCVVLALRPVADRPVLLGTSRHVTGGLQDVAGEDWDPLTGVLSGKSAVVAHDRYELRLHVPAGWTLLTPVMADQAGAPALDAAIHQNGTDLRIEWTPDRTAELGWKIGFRAGGIAAQNTAVVASPRPTPSDWRTRHEALVARKRSGDIRVLFIGDSITEGWVTRGKAVWSERYGRLGAADFGIGGDRTENLLWRIQHGEMDGKSPAVTVLLIGTNNLGHNTPAEIAAGVEANAVEILRRAPDTKLLLLGIFPRGRTSSSPLRLAVRSVNERLGKWADGRRVFFLDLGARFLAADGSLPTAVMADYVHPTATGYQIWADAMDSRLAQLLR